MKFRKIIVFALAAIAVFNSSACVNQTTNQTSASYTTESENALGRVVYSDIVNWQNIKDIKFGMLFAVGLKTDGSVVTSGSFNVPDNTGTFHKISTEELAALTNIKQIQTKEFNIIGLKNDGSVVHVGWELKNENAVNSWKNISKIVVSNTLVVGLKTDGEIVMTGDSDSIEAMRDALFWTDLVDVAVTTPDSADLQNKLEFGYILGLKKDGTVVQTGYGRYEIITNDWNNIKSIHSPYYTTVVVGLKNDGTLVASGDNKYHHCDVDSWIGVKHISITALCTFGFTDDGKLLSTGPDLIQTGFVHDVKDIFCDIIPTRGICLQNDGTLTLIP